VGDTITRVANETGGSSGGVERHNGLEGDVDVLDLESFEHDGDHLFAVGLGVTGSFSQKDTECLFRRATELVVESVVPDLLHIFPGFDDTCGDWVLKIKDTSLLHGLVTNVLGFLLDTLHGRGVLRAANDGGEDSAGSVFTSKTGLDHAGTVVDDDCLLFTHLIVGYVELVG